MGTRDYRQYCALPNALDAIGERWTLLIVRELCLGPMRYNDLIDAMNGIGGNLLASRLKKLEGLKITEKILYEGIVHYALTSLGESLRPIVIDLLRWGLNLLVDTEGQFFGNKKHQRERTDWVVTLIEALAGDVEITDGEDQPIYSLIVDERPYYAILSNNRLQFRRGEPKGSIKASLVITSALIHSIYQKKEKTQSLLRDNQISTTGKSKESKKFLKILFPRGGP